MSYISQHIDDYNDRFADTREYILYSLGWPVVEVHLTNEHLSMAIMDAVSKYYDRAASDLTITVADVEPGNEVTIPSTIKGSKIENVIFPGEVIDNFARGMFVAGTEDAFGKYVIPQQSWTNILDNFDMVGYYMFLRRMEDFKKLVGIDRHWDIVNGKIQVYPATASITKIGIVSKAEFSDESLETSEWVKEWSLAKAKHVLGTIRSRMSGFTVAGGNIATDGEAMRTEANEEMNQLKEKLANLQKPLPFMQI